MAEMPLLAVVNPHARGGKARAVWQRIEARLSEAGAEVRSVETRGDGRDAERIREAVRSSAVDRVIAAGGDGTVRDVAEAILSCGAAPAPALSFAPLGTANNAARAFGLESCGASADHAIDAVVRAALGRRVRRLDLGRINGRIFVGSVSLAMDGDILAMRNRLRGRLPRVLGGYPLYLWCCAVCFGRRHGGPARIELPHEEPRSGPIYNLLVTNTPIYAGEFRFAAGDCFADGQLDVLPSRNVGEYAASYTAAWPRHLRARAGREVQSDPRIFRTASLRIRFESAMTNQIDGEEGEPSTQFDIEVVPSALDVCVR